MLHLGPPPTACVSNPFLRALRAITMSQARDTMAPLQYCCWVLWTVSLCILCKNLFVHVAWIVAVIGQQVPYFAEAERWAVASVGAWVRWSHHMFLTFGHCFNLLDLELTWACPGSTGVITYFPDVVTDHDLPTCLSSCRVAAAMEPVHAQCLMVHWSKIQHLEVVRRLWSTDIRLSICSLSANDRFFLIWGVLHTSRTYVCSLPVSLASLGVSCRWEQDLPRHFIRKIHS